MARKNLVGFFSGPIKKHIRNKGNGAEGAEDFLAGQILRHKNLEGFPKTVRKIFVGIPSDEICPPKSFLDEIPPWYIEEPALALVWRASRRFSKYCSAGTGAEAP